MEPEIKIDDFSYNLPEEKIAKYPLPSRDDSKILIFKDNVVSDDKFSNLAEFVPENSLMIFNNTKVVPARLFSGKIAVLILKSFVLNRKSHRIIPLHLNLLLNVHGNVSLVTVKNGSPGLYYLTQPAIRNLKIINLLL